MHKGMSGHQSAHMCTDEWLTPPEIIKALGEFDLDPCSPITRPWPTAKLHYTVENNGLALPWKGRVWLNPPYGQEGAKWLRKLVLHGNGIALIFARTETRMFSSSVWNSADAILFLQGRLFFHYVDGRKATANAGAPSCLVAYGNSNVDALRQSGLAGKLITL
jgi:hypothetical protein